MGYYYIAYFFGGAFFANAIPHYVSGIMGRAFQSPFAQPSGIGLSSAKINIWWGMFNFIVSYFLIFQVGDFEFHQLFPVGALGLGILVMGLFGANHFGKLHGGDKSTPAMNVHD